MELEFLLLRPEMLTREILNILNVLTETTKLPLMEAREIVALQIQRNHYTYVGYRKGVPVCIGSIVILSKIGKNGGRSALIEDVAVKADCQSKGYGKLLVNFLKEKAIAYNVYKVFLNCSDENVPFYIKCGFNQAGNQMRYDCS